jgi:hypothetical protein
VARLLAAIALTALLLPVQSAGTHALQGNCRTFPETGQQVCGLFLRYWDSHGGLAQQGLPITGELREVSQTDGKTYFVQYFERAVFEEHPENSGTEYEVLLSLLGTILYDQRYPSGAPNQRASIEPGSRFFPRTGRHVGGRFLEYWESNGGLQQQGLPISDLFVERSDINGKMYTVQYFERAVFEWHPENARPYDVLLSQLGSFQHLAKYGWMEGSRAQELLRRRPLQLPVLRRGESCMPAQGRNVSRRPFGTLFGTGPIYAGLGTSPAIVNLKTGISEGGWYLVKTLWVADPAFVGPVLIRGGRIDTPGEMRFGPGPDPLPSLELVATPPADNTRWHDWPQYTRIREPGCYAFQLDSITFTRTIVFEARN